MITEKLLILGTGTMGHTIALGAALSGITSTVWGVSDDDLQKGHLGLMEKLERLVDEGAVDETMKVACLDRIVFICDLEVALEGVTFVIEAVPENLELKKQLYKRLEALSTKDVVFASNTSGFKASDISANMKHKERVIITHFWNPGHLIPLVEVVPSGLTTEAVKTRTMNMMKAMGKKPILMKKEMLGFIGNRLQWALFREAQHLVLEGAVTFEEVDEAIKYSIGRRLSVTGPFMTADMAGLDVVSSLLSYLYDDLNNDTSKKLIDQQVELGNLGQKNGVGFYEWTPGFSKKINEERERELIRWLKADQEKNEKGEM